MRFERINKLSLAFLTLIFVSYPWCLHAEEAALPDRLKIAVMGFEVQEGLKPGLGVFLHDMLLERVVTLGKHTVVDGHEVARIVERIFRSQSDISEEDAIRQALSQLGVQKICFGSLSKAGTKYYVTVRIQSSDLTVDKVLKAAAETESTLEGAVYKIARQLTLTREELRQMEKVEAAWETAQVLDTAVAYGEFLEAFPASRYTADATARLKELELPFTLEMVFIKGGTFHMGSPPSEEGRAAHEGPVHEVQLGDFYLGKYEVTFEQFDAFCRALGRTEPSDSRWGRGKRPVVNVNRDDAVAFCKWLSDSTGKNYRLPTEAEWEYACRAGTTTRYSFGNSPKDLRWYAWYEPNTRFRTYEVGKMKPNPWGLHDMHGNVWEWCADRYGADYYRVSPTDNPKGPNEGQYRVVRGGCWDNKAGTLRSAVRLRCLPEKRTFRIGFRVARDP